MITGYFMKKEDVLYRIGRKIKKIREEKNISQQELAGACNFEKSNMSRIEAGRSNLTIGTLLKVCEFLEIKLVDIVDVE